MTNIEKILSDSAATHKSLAQNAAHAGNMAEAFTHERRAYMARLLQRSVEVNRAMSGRLIRPKVLVEKIVH